MWYLIVGLICFMAGVTLMFYAVKIGAVVIK